MNGAQVVEQLTAFSHAGHDATSAQPASLTVDDDPTQVRLTVWRGPLGPTVWTFPLDLLDEAQTGPARRGDCRARLALYNCVAYLVLALPTSAGCVQGYWLYSESVDRFRAAALDALDAEFAALTGGLG